MIIRNRPRTQRIARDIHHEAQWSGITWWSLHRPQWRVHALWDHHLDVLRIESLPGHPGLIDAARTLDKELMPDLR